MKPYKPLFKENESGIPEFRIVDYGVDHAQYFPGHGISHTKWEHSVTGAGDTPQDAVNEAIEQIAMMYDISNEFADAIEKKAKEMYGDSYDVTPDVILKSYQETDDEDNPNPEYSPNSELYYYVSIDFNLSGKKDMQEKKLTYAQKKELPKSDFVYPKDRKYPIPDVKHARNALARVAQHGTEAEKKRVKAAVHKKFPEIGKKEESTQSYKPLFTEEKEVIPQSELLKQLKEKFPDTEWGMKEGRITIKKVGKASDGNPLWTYDAHGIGGGGYKKYPDASTHEELFNFLEDRGWYLENQNYHEVKIYPIDKEPVEIEESTRKPYQSLFTEN